MSNKIVFTTTVPENVPSYYIIEPPSVNWTIPKLYVPKGKDGKPTLDRPWYVWFRFRNPETGKFDKTSKFIYKRGINQKYKTVKGRTAFGKQLVATFTKLLEQGFVPYKNTVYYEDDVPVEFVSCKDALLWAFEQKKKELARSTISDWNSRLNKFIEYAEKERFAKNHIHTIEGIQIAMFFNHLADQGQSAKSINNFRGCLSALFGKLAGDMVITHNPVQVLKKRKEKSNKNKPFTPEEIKEIKDYLLKYDPGLLTFIRFVAYAFLRPVEIVRLTVGDIDLVNHRLTVKTKTEEMATVRIIPQLAADLKALDLDKFKKSFYLFTPSGTPGPWLNQRTGKPTAENTRTKEFSDRFVKVKKHFGFGEEYSIYSFRHSAAIDIYNSLISEGLTTMEAELKMLPITRHKSISGLRNYLRGIGALMAKDYGGKFSIDL